MNKKKVLLYVGYQEHKNIFINNLNLIEYFRKLYIDTYLNSQEKNIDEFLILAHQEIFKIRDKFESKVSIDEKSWEIINKTK